MDIIRITLAGQGYDVIRGIVAKKEYNKIKNSLNNVWVKDLNKRIAKNLKGFIKEFHDYGIAKGDMVITVNNQEFVNLPISVLEGYSFNGADLVDLEGYSYPIVDDDVVITSVQKLEGVFMDVMFITQEEFDITKLKFVEKIIQDENENTIIDSLISEVYYDGQEIIFTGNNTDLRMAKIYCDIGKEKVIKNEKNNNR
jgi:hypothetical protein